MSEIDPKRVHLIERDDIHILFFKDTLEFFEIPAHVADEARPVVLQNPEFIDIEEISLKREDGNNKLNILQLNISEDCNLQCEYCVADGGRYGRDAILMTPEIALQALDLFYSYYDEIRTIQFFGGEPFLNVKVIREVAKYVSLQKEKVPDFQLPILNINTNGTILNDEIISLINDYSLQIVISLDGVPMIHDRFRKTRSGEDTYNRIVENIHRMSEKTNQPSAYEMVYGTHYNEAGWSLRKTLEYLDQNLPTKEHVIFTAPLLVSDTTAPHLKEYSGYHEDLIEPTFEAIRLGFEDIKKDKKPLFHYIINKFIKNLMGKKPVRLFCGPCVSKLMVDASGNIYPCNALVDKEDFKIGHVSNKNCLSQNLSKHQEFFLSKRKTTHYKECATCWAFNLCHFCMAHIFQGDKPDMDQLNPEICKFHRAIIEEVVVEIGRISKNPEAWQRFKQYVEAI